MILYESTVPLDETLAIGSSNAEFGLLSIDMDGQGLDGCESAQRLGDQMEDYLEKGIALDSDDEGEKQNEAANSASSFGVAGRFSGRHAAGLLRGKQAPVGYFRKLNKVSEHVLHGLGSAVSGRSGEESTTGRTDLYNDDRFQERHMVVDSVVSRSSVNKEYLDMERESSMEELHQKKLPSHEPKHMTMGKDTSYDCNRTEFNYFGSPQVADSQDKAMQFINNYLSLCDLGSYKDIPSRMTDVLKSPPCLRSMGTQSLARRLTLGSTASKLTAFDWADKELEKTECASPRLHNDSVFGIRGDKCGSVCVHQESPGVKWHNEISILQPEEKLPGNMSSPNNLDTVCVSSNDSEKIGLSSGIFIIPDSVELDEQLDAGISSQNADNIERHRLTPEESFVGLDTQMAAEAMEELVHASPPRVDASFTHQGSDNSLLGSSNMVNNKDESYLASHKVAFVDWKRKENRSKFLKISTVQDKPLSRLASKRFKNQLGTVSQSVVGKKLMIKKQMADKESFNKRGPETTTNRCFAAPSQINVQQEDCGTNEGYSSKQSRKLDHLCRRVKYEPPSKGRKTRSSFREGAPRKGINRTSLRSNSAEPSFEVKADSDEGKENHYPGMVDMTLPELNPWVFPKRKRTRQCKSCLAITPSNQCLPFAAVDNNLEKYPIVKLHEEAVGEVAKLLVYNRRHKVSPVNNSAVPHSQVQTLFASHGTLDDGSTNMKSEGSGKRKQSLSPLSRSPLMKELMRLGYTDSLPDFLPKDSRRRRATNKLCILFSQNLDTSTLKQQKKIVSRLGFSIASCSSDATHFVADRFVRTRNMLEAIGLGKPVVTHLWLESCEQAGYVIDEKSYILRDEKKEKEYGFNMHVTLTRANQLPILKGRRVFITPNVKPGLDVITSLVKIVQGQVVQKILNAKTKDELIHKGLLILSSEADYKICLQFLQKGAFVYDSELLLNGIVTQKLEYDRYRLFKDDKENGDCCVS